MARAYGEALETLAIDAETRGERASASRWWRLLAEHEPLSSRVIMRLMSALAAYGDRAGALHQAQRYEVGVSRELEASPNPDVRALADRLRWSPAGDAPASKATSFSLAVLPITNLSAASSNDHVAVGLVEELTSRLARLDGVRLLSVPTPESATRASLNAVLEGSIREANGRIRLILRLIDPADGRHLWSQRYERSVENVFDLQDELAEEILGELGTVLRR